MHFDQARLGSGPPVVVSAALRAALSVARVLLAAAVEAAQLAAAPVSREEGGEVLGHPLSPG